MSADWYTLKCERHDLQRMDRSGPYRSRSTLASGSLGVQSCVVASELFLLVVGIWLFDTLRLRRREARLEKAKGGQHAGIGVPSDIHNYTGWQQAGRSQTMDTLPEAVDADGD